MPVWKDKKVDSSVICEYVSSQRESWEERKGGKERRREGRKSTKAELLL